MSRLSHQPSRASGKCRTSGGLVRTQVPMDEETFADVFSGAVANGCSFAAQARMLIEVGLEAMKEPVR